MRVGFAGTPDFAASALESILAAGFEVPVVLTQPDRPKGRGLALAASAVRQLAIRHALPVLQPPTLKSEDARAPLRSISLDVLVVAAYGLILPSALLSWPRHGCLNIHASLLPRWRGAAPIARALLAGDAHTGITIMQMDNGVDTGPMIERVGVDIAAGDTAGVLHERLAQAGARLIVAVLQRLARDGRLDATPQPETGATYAAKIERREAAVDWHQNAIAIDRRIRAFNPVPGAFTALRGESWKLWRAVAMPADTDTRTAPGTIVRIETGAIVVACGSGALQITELQPAGGKRLSAAAALAGRRIGLGDRFASAPEQPGA